MRYSVSLTIDGPVEVLLDVEADSAEEALELAVNEVDSSSVLILGHQGAEAHLALPFD